MDKIKDHPNPIANIGFICFTPFHYYVYKNIYAYLPNAEFIVGDYYGSLDKNEEKQRIKRVANFLQRQSVSWRYIDHDDIPLLPERYGKYGLLVSCLYKGAITHTYNDEKIKVRILYGNAKDKWNFGIWNAFFDRILTYGPYSQKHLKIYGNATIVGNPKFDDWFDNKKELQNNVLKRKLDKGKKTILYLPTYGILSSQDVLYSILRDLTKEYNVITKLHYNTSLFEKEIVEKYKKTKCILKDDTDDIVQLLKYADVVISDNSGAIFDALFADIPIVCIDNTVSFNGRARYENSMYYDQERTYLGVRTNSQSLEQKIKKKEFSIGPILKIDNAFLQLSRIKQSKQLSELIKGAYVKKNSFHLKRKKLKNKLFAPISVAGKQAARELENLLYTGKPRKNLLSDQIIGYIHHINQENRQKFAPTIDTQKSVMVIYERIRSLPFLPKLYFIWKEFF